MSRMYTVSFRGIAVTAVQDLFELTAADDKPIRIAGLFIAQDTDHGDAEAEALDLRIRRGNTTSGNGTAVTPVAVDPGDPASSFTAERNASTQASAGTAVELHSDHFQVQAGYMNWWPEDCRPKTNQGAGLLCISLETAPADSVTLSATVYVEEL